MLKIYFSTFLFCICFIFSDVQARSLLNNTPYIVMNGGAYIVPGNSNSNTLTSMVAGIPTSNYTDGRIISEGGNNKIKWFEVILPVNSSSDKKYDLFFYDNLGRRIHSEAINVSKCFNTKILNPKKFATGIYYVTLMNEEEVVAKKVVMH